MLQHIAELNSRAISLMQDGKLSESVSLLKDCLTPIKHQIENGQADDFHQVEQISVAKNTLGEAKAIRTIQSVSVAKAESVPDDFYLLTLNTFFPFFERAFLVPRSERSQLKIQGTVSLAILLYNIGLVLHKEGTSNPDSKKLFNALTFYELALSAIQNEWNNIEMQDILPMLLALVNNMGHIHWHFVNFQKVVRCYEWLKDLTALGEGSNSLNDEDYALFYLVANSFDDLELSCAPAA